MSIHNALHRAAGIAALVLVPVLAHATVVNVDCSGATPGAFTTINAALVTLSATGPHTVNVYGACTEHAVVIGKSDVLIQGLAGATLQPPLATAATSPALLVRSSIFVRIQDLAITGGFLRIEDSRASYRGSVEHSPVNGIVVAGDSAVLLFPSTIRHNALAGIVVEPAASLNLQGGSAIEDNEGTGLNVSGVARLFTGLGSNVIQRNGAGIDVGNGGKLQMIGGTSVLDNEWCGIQVGLGASASFSAATTPAGVIGVTVKGNGDLGMNVAAGAAVNMTGPHKITQNGAGSETGGGVRVGSTSRIQFNAGVEIVDNTGPGLLAEWNAAAFFYDTTVSGNTAEGIRITRGSVARVDAGTLLGGNGAGPLACDTTALVSGTAPALGGVHANACARIERENGKPRPGMVR